jgi:hypothetical protein
MSNKIPGNRAGRINITNTETRHYAEYRKPSTNFPQYVTAILGIKSSKWPLSSRSFNQKKEKDTVPVPCVSPVKKNSSVAYISVRTREDAHFKKYCH